MIVKTYSIRWEDAPEWAQWAAQDADGEWWWYEAEPIRYVASWARHVGRRDRIEELEHRWRDTLEKRP